MRFSDFIDPNRGPEALVRLALYPLIVLLVFAALSTILSQLGAGGLLLAFLGLAFVSALAYLIREARQGRTQHQGTRRGAERTPLLPHNEEDR
jgi:membrane protein implicated in regulation of membrane protease activity